VIEHGQTHIAQGKERRERERERESTYCVDILQAVEPEILTTRGSLLLFVGCDWRTRPCQLRAHSKPEKRDSEGQDRRGKRTGASSRQDVQLLQNLALHLGDLQSVLMGERRRMGSVIQ
jgi:hypothetical protein